MIVAARSHHFSLPLQRKEDGDSSKVHRASGEWLWSPIERKGLHGFLKMGLAGTLEEFACFRIERKLS